MIRRIAPFLSENPPGLGARSSRRQEFSEFDRATRFDSSLAASRWSVSPGVEGASTSASRGRLRPLLAMTPG